MADSPPALPTKRKRYPITDVLYLHARQDPASVPACDNVGNDVLSCYPTSETVVTQNEYIRFVWNQRYPLFIGAGTVDIYLLRADGDTVAADWRGVDNTRGSISVPVNDSWWDARADQWNGTEVRYPFYFTILPGGEPRTGGEMKQPTFIAVQTQAPASLSSSSVVSVSSTSASFASATRSFGTNTAGAPNPTGSLQTSGGAGQGLPTWAIAVLAVLGVLALVSLLLLVYLLIRNIRERRKRLSHRASSIGSSSPMMGQRPSSFAPPQSPPLDSSPTVPTHHGSSLAQPTYPTTTFDGASTTSRANSAAEGLFSGADAAIISSAFRQALRRPDFADRPVEEGDSPETDDQRRDDQRRDAELLNRELAEEGRDIRSVSSARGYKVENEEQPGGDSSSKPPPAG